MSIPNFITNPDPEIYLSNNYVVLDFETTNVNKGSPYDPDNRILLSCWKECEGGKTNHSSNYTWGSEYENDRLLRAIEKADFIVAHNAKFDIAFLKNIGYHCRNIRLL